MNNEVLPQVSIVLILKGDEISLAMKKRGFGVGHWNGYGGKRKSLETIEEAAIRETNEECGTEIRQMKEVGIINFYFPDKPEWNQQAVVFKAESGQWEGEPKETEEMRPQWFKIDQIPYEAMWCSDKYWLPKALKGEEIISEIIMNGGEKLISVIINGEKIDVS